MPDNRETLQVNQPDIINLPETNWPDPLVDPSNKLKMVVTNGGNGTQKNFDPITTSQQDNKEHHLTEGPTKSTLGSPNSATDTGGGKGTFTETSQQKRGEHSLWEQQGSVG